MKWLIRVLAESRRVALLIGALVGAVLGALSGRNDPVPLVLQAPCGSLSKTPESQPGLPPSVPSKK